MDVVKVIFFILPALCFGCENIDDINALAAQVGTTCIDVSALDPQASDEQKCSSAQTILDCIGEQFGDCRDPVVITTIGTILDSLLTETSCPALTYGGVSLEEFIAAPDDVDVDDSGVDPLCAATALPRVTTCLISLTAVFGDDPTLDLNAVVTKDSSFSTMCPVIADGTLAAGMECYKNELEACPPLEATIGQLGMPTLEALEPHIEVLTSICTADCPQEPNVYLSAGTDCLAELLPSGQTMEQLAASDGVCNATEIYNDCLIASYSDCVSLMEAQILDSSLASDPTNLDQSLSSNSILSLISDCDLSMPANAANQFNVGGKLTLAMVALIVLVVGIIS